MSFIGKQHTLGCCLNYFLKCFTFRKENSARHVETSRNIISDLIAWDLRFSLLLGSCRWLIKWRGNAARLCGLRGDVAHLTPPASHLPHSKQLQQSLESAGQQLLPVSIIALPELWDVPADQHTEHRIWVKLENLTSSLTSVHWNVLDFAGRVWHILKPAHN